MATRTTFGSMNPSGQNQIDLIDVAALIFLPIAASMIFGVFSLSIDVFGNYDFTEPIWTVGGADISVALLVTVFAVGWVLATNVMNEQTQHEGYELAVIAVAILLPVAYVFVPAVESLVQWHDLTQLMALLYVSIATVWISFTG